MKKILLASAFLGIFSFAAAAQATRPRVAVTPTPPTIKNDTVTRDPRSGPPVLQDAQKPDKTSNDDTANKGDGSDEVLKVQTNLVTMPVSVLDRDGRFVSGLGQQDFKIFENGVEQKLEYFQSVEQPFTVVLLLDVSGSMSSADRLPLAIQSMELLLGSLKPTDTVALLPDASSKVRLRRAELRALL